MVSLTFALTMRLSEVPMLIASLRRVSSVSRPQEGSRSLFGQLLGGRVLPMITLSREVLANGSFVVHCDVVFVLWGVVFRALGIQWMLPRRVADLLFKWRNWLGKHS